MYKQMSEWKKYIPNMQSVRNEESPELKRSCRDVRVKELEVIKYFPLLQKKIKPPQRMQEKLVIHSVTSGVHRALLDILSGRSVPKKERTPQIVAAYRIKMRKIASCAMIMNPLSGEIENRVVVDVDNSGEKKILLQNNEVQSCIKYYYTKYKGAGARKLYNGITQSFCGVAEREIQSFLNNQEISQQLNPSFINKQPLKPVSSKRVMDRIQMDIVDLMRSPVHIYEKTFRYVLVVLDVFSRYVFLRPLQSKSSAEVATHVVQMFSDVGPPKIVQTDQGTEFKGVVERVMEKFKIHIIHSRPYHPQSQGKVLFSLIVTMSF